MNRYEIYGYKMYSKIMQQNAHLNVTDTEPGSSNSFKMEIQHKPDFISVLFFLFYTKEIDLF